MSSVEPYRELLGKEWDALAAGVRVAHSLPLRARGDLRITRAERGLAGLLARRIELPPVGDAVPTELTLESCADGVEWVRRFGSMRAVSLQRVKNGRVYERAGPFEMEIALRAVDGAVHHRQTGVRLFGRRVPMFFGPTVEGEVEPGPDETSWRVNIRIGHPFLGELCAYSGIMRAE